MRGPFSLIPIHLFKRKQGAQHAGSCLCAATIPQHRHLCALDSSATSPPIRNAIVRLLDDELSDLPRGSPENKTGWGVDFVVLFISKFCNFEHKFCHKNLSRLCH